MMDQAKVMRTPISLGIGKVTKGQKNKNVTIGVDYIFVLWGISERMGYGVDAMLNFCNIDIDAAKDELTIELTPDIIRYIKKYIRSDLSLLGEKYFEILNDLHDDTSNVILVFLYKNVVSKSVESIYLKLFALSKRLVKPSLVNLSDMYNILPNVAWAGSKPYELVYLREMEVSMKLSKKQIHITSVGQLPRYLDHIIPDDNIRIMRNNNVSLGACLANQTTVMPGASYIDCRSVTLGATMIEGRLNNVSLEKDTDIGGGSTLYSIDEDRILTIGSNTLVGANAVVNMSLGKSCIVDGGLNLLRDSIVFITEEEFLKIKEKNPDCRIDYKENFTANELEGLNSLHFRRDSQNGQVIVFKSSREIELNYEFH